MIVPRIRKIAGGCGYTCRSLVIDFSDPFYPVNRMVVGDGDTEQQAYDDWLLRLPTMERKEVRARQSAIARQRRRAKRMELVGHLLSHDAIALVGLLAMVAYIIFG